jgi:triosephosphate isomerase
LNQYSSNYKLIIKGRKHMNKKLIAGNWKMNGHSSDAIELCRDVRLGTKDVTHVDWLVCPPSIHIPLVNDVPKGGQDCSIYGAGAHTGDISATMLRDMMCDYCLCGHSERRQNHGETNDVVRNKAEQIVNAQMTAIICVGETLDERESGKAFEVVERQIRESMPQSATSDTVVIAYEPVWAIGTGKAATKDDVADMHNQIRELLKSLVASGGQMRIIYGGSVKPSNAGELLNLDNVDGALIGGASLNADDFIAIGNAVQS